jgi:Na+:H+ antiporter, NhaA family
MPRETSAAIGELAGLRRAALPLAAALGGMLVPAAIFVALNAGRGGAAGWAIPMATDIAFAVGVLTLLGSRVPASWRILLLALAVIDDIGAIVVIAVFYTDGVAISGLLTTALGMLLVFALRGVGVRAPAAFLVPGAIIWAGLYGAGVHPRSLASLSVWPHRCARGSDRLGSPRPRRSISTAWPATAISSHCTIAWPRSSEHVARPSRPRSGCSTCHPWVAFGVMPLFALANAGVALGGADLAGDGLFIFLGIVLLAWARPAGGAGRGDETQGSGARKVVCVS